MTRHPERSAAKSTDPAELALGFAPGLKAWPRGLRPLRYSLDFARNDWKLRCGEQTPAHSDLHVPITV